MGHADLDLLDPVTGQSQVLVGDHANAQGYIAATIPAGTWDVRIETPQGSHAATLFVPVVTVAIPLLLTVALSDKDVVTDLQTYGVPTIGQGGSFPVNLSLENTTLSTMALAFEAFVRLPNGTHLPVAPTIPLDVPAQQLMGLVGSWVSIPVVPTNELGRQLRLRTRITDRTTGTVLDEAQVRFVVQ